MKLTMKHIAGHSCEVQLQAFILAQIMILFWVLSLATILRPGEGISLALYEAYELDIAMVNSCRPLFKHKLFRGSFSGY
jgi:hypothetical protein